MLNHPDWSNIFAPQGVFLKEGELIRRTNYSRTLAQIAEEGADAFYTVRSSRFSDHGSLNTLGIHCRFHNSHNQSYGWCHNPRRSGELYSSRRESLRGILPRPESVHDPRADVGARYGAAAYCDLILRTNLLQYSFTCSI